jgi:hypothetical protein
MERKKRTEIRQTTAPQAVSLPTTVSITWQGNTSTPSVFAQLSRFGSTGIMTLCL